MLTLFIFVCKTGDHLLAPVSQLPTNRWNLFFDVLSLPNQETLTAAELRLTFSTVKNGSNNSVANGQQNRANCLSSATPGDTSAPCHYPAN